MLPSAEIQATTLKSFLDAWEAWDFGAWFATFDDDFVQVTLPFTLGIPPKSRAEVSFALPHLMQVVEDYELTIHEIIHDASKSKAAIYAISKGNSRFGPWTMEYSVFVTFNQAGDRIARVEEMLDSAFMQQFAPKFRKYLQDSQAVH